MSIGFIPTISSLSKYVWEYYKRGLTVNVLYEGYTVAKTIYRAKEYFRPNDRIVAKVYGASRALLAFPEDDLIPKATETFPSGSFDTTKIKDHDDDTGVVTPTVSGPILKYDLGSPGYYLLIVRAEIPATVVLNVAVSEDGSTWDIVFNWFVGSTETRFGSYFGYFRYVKFEQSDSVILYTVEAYPLQEVSTTEYTYDKLFDTEYYGTISLLTDGLNPVHALLYKVRSL